MSRLDRFFRKAEKAAADLVEAFRFGIFGPPPRPALDVERMRAAGPRDFDSIFRALKAGNPFLSVQEMTMKTTPPAADPATIETVLISTPDVSRVMARLRAIAMGHPRETDAAGKPLPALDLVALILILGSDLLNLRTAHEATEKHRAQLDADFDELRTVSANDNRCNAEVIEKLRADLSDATSLNDKIREANTIECGVLRDVIRDQRTFIDKLKAAETETADVAEGRGAMLEAGSAVLDQLRREKNRLQKTVEALEATRATEVETLSKNFTEMARLQRVNDEMAEHERATSISIATLQAEVAGLTERLARTTEERDRLNERMARAPGVKVETIERPLPVREG